MSPYLPLFPTIPAPPLTPPPPPRFYFLPVLTHILPLSCGQIPALPPSPPASFHFGYILLSLSLYLPHIPLPHTRLLFLRRLC